MTLPEHQKRALLEALGILQNKLSTLKKQKGQDEEQEAQILVFEQSIRKLTANVIRL